MTTGEYGGRCLRAFPSEKNFKRGDILTTDEMMGIPIRNRLALERAGMIEFFAEPADSEGALDQLTRENQELKDEISSLKAQIVELVKQKADLKDELTIENILDLKATDRKKIVEGLKSLGDDDLLKIGEEEKADRDRKFLLDLIDAEIEERGSR